MSRSHNNKKTCRSHQGYSRESGVGNALGAQVGRFVFVRSAVDKNVHNKWKPLSKSFCAPQNVLKRISKLKCPFSLAMLGAVHTLRQNPNISSRTHDSQCDRG